MSVQVNNTRIKIDISIIPKSSLMSPSSPLTSTKITSIQIAFILDEFYLSKTLYKWNHMVYNLCLAYLLSRC